MATVGWLPILARWRSSELPMRALPVPLPRTHASCAAREVLVDSRWQLPAPWRVARAMVARWAATFPESPRSALAIQVGLQPAVPPLSEDFDFEPAGHRALGS